MSIGQRWDKWEGVECQGEGLGAQQSRGDCGRTKCAIDGAVETRMALDELIDMRGGGEPFAERNRDAWTPGRPGLAVDHDFSHRMTMVQDKVEEGGSFLHGERGHGPILRVLKGEGDVPCGEVVGGHE